MRIDPEFKALMPPLTEDEFKRLETSIITEGCRDALVVWGDVLVDGHNRYEICTKHGVKFETIQKEFETREDVKKWIITNQIGRRNLTPFQRVEFALQLEEMYVEEARRRQATSTGGAAPQLRVNFPEADKARARDKIGEIAGVSGKQVDKVKKVLLEAPEEVVEKARKGEISINKAYDVIKKKTDLEEKRAVLIEKAKAVEALPETIRLIHGDFLTEYKQLGECSVDCIITDPPYVKEWLHNYKPFAKAAAYVLKPGGFLISYVGNIHIDQILDQMRQHLDYYWIACLKHAGTISAVHSRGVQCGYKPILIMQKPPLTKPKRYFGDVIQGTGREKDAHEWQQGEEELRRLFEPFTDPGDVVLDPFMGSGTVISMAQKMSRLAIGFDIDRDNVEIVRWRVAGGNTSSGGPVRWCKAGGEASSST
jgi:ParB-like chromosome segregation protein Spo0J